MKIRFYLLFAFVSFCSLLNSVTYHIKQDGTGNFTTIQEGIIASANSDTILVYPGTYYENIDYLEKSLTVASLYIITPEDSLINQTVIDGNQEARCVKIDECETASIIGFTIQNGKACYANSQDRHGGGIYIESSSNVEINNCIIQNNNAHTGGGIHCNQSVLILAGNTIKHNWGLRGGGGISLFGNITTVEFDENNLNDIYYNYAATGSEIYITEVVQAMNIYIDTLTVSDPDFFYINPSHKYTFYGLHSKIVQIDQDIFVSPDGNDDNNGLTPEEPLQTLAWAQTLIKRNDVNPNTIHLSSGTYSPSLNNQKFPLNIKHGVIIKGVSPDETVLDAEEISPLICYNSKEDIYVSLNFQNLSIVNAVTFDFPSVAVIDIAYQADVYFENIYIRHSTCGIRGAIFCNDGFYHFENIIINNNSGAFGVDLGANYQNNNPTFEVVINNSIINNNIPGTEEGSGGALKLNGHSEIIGEYNAQLINCKISENYNNFYNPQTDMGGTSGLYMKDMVLIDAINCTFGDNTLSHSTGCVITVNKSELNFYNSILYNNDGYSFNLWEDAVVNISHSLIEGGDDNVNYYYPLATVNWLDGNLDENPMFDSLGTYPFALLENSPCINAGTLDLPSGIELPEYDLAGNPRIYGETIDMGAYEFQGDPQSINENAIEIPTITQISNYPNPFNPYTTIKLDLAEPGKIEFAIYNIKGQKVKTLLNAYSSKGHFEIIWRGIDDNKKKVASGNYFVKLKVNGEEKAVSKCVLLK